MTRGSKIEKKKTEETVKCMICLEICESRTKMNRCSHFFCLVCIQRWVEVTNCCPLCKVPSLSLHTFLAKGGKLKIRIKAKTHTHVDDAEDLANLPDFADVCYVCGDEGCDTELLVCDNCDYKIAHLKCVGFTKVPEGVWNCAMCKEQLGS